MTIPTRSSYRICEGIGCFQYVLHRSKKMLRLLMQYNEEVANSRPSSLQLGENDIDQEEAQIQDLSKDVLEQFGDKNCGLQGWVNL